MIGIACQHLLDVGSANECHSVADTGGVQFTNGYKFIDVLTGTAHAVALPRNIPPTV